MYEGGTMKLILGMAVSAAAAVLIPAGASAQQEGFYASLGGGLNFLDDSDFDIAGGVGVDNQYDTGFIISGAVGYATAPVWDYGSLRLEGEVSYRQNDIDVHSVAALGGDQPGSTGEASALAFMANVYHDFLPGSDFRPYVGGGIGLASIEFSDYGIAAVPDVLDDDDTAFAYQLIAGASYSFTPQLAATIDYRFFAADPELETSAATGSVSNDVDYQSQTIMVGLRYTF